MDEVRKAGTEKRREERTTLGERVSTRVDNHQRSHAHKDQSRAKGRLIDEYSTPSHFKVICHQI